MHEYTNYCLVSSQDWDKHSYDNILIKSTGGTVRLVDIKITIIDMQNQYYSK